MLTFLVETKQEYTTQLINVLTPLVYEGLQSVYTEVSKSSPNEHILKYFQMGMQKIPKWNNETIKNETQRIMNNSKSYSWLEDLIKATLKANIIVLTYNPSVSAQVKVDPSLYQNIKIEDFIHIIYIECARELWNNPYLFYHNYPPIELKRNHRDSILLIKDCIKEGIRKFLPVKHILQIYLGEEEVIVNHNDNNFDKSISDFEEKNITRLVQKDLYTPNEYSKKIENKANIVTDNNSNKIIKNNNSNKIIENNNYTITQDTVGAKILGIINGKTIKLTDNQTDNQTDNKTSTDMRIKKIIENDLNETETSICNKNTGHFEEVFSNGDQKEQNIPKNDDSQKTFLNNYLNNK
jgi:hypothetical protein